jgi:hypothetical protein
MALVAVVVLGVPKIASAGQPSVQAPTGPKSGGVFTGTFTFITYIYCTTGPSYQSTYSSNLEGTNTFTFYGAGDGSLLLSINGGGQFLLNSCGDPFTGSHTVAAVYTFTKNSSAPPPTPTPAPPPTPSPTPTTAHGSGSGGSGGSAGGGGTGSSNSSAAATEQPDASNAGDSGAAPTPVASQGAAGPAIGLPQTRAAGQAAATLPSSGILEPGLGLATIPIGRTTMAVARSTFITILLSLFLAAWWRRRHPKDRLAPTRLDRAALRLEPYTFRLRRAIKRLLRSIRARFFVHHKDAPKSHGFSPHWHSGKLTAHHHTSYASLAFLLLLAGVITSAATVSTFAASESSILSLTVQGAPPATGATISQPTDGQHFSTSTTTVRGNCPTGVFVEIWRNGTFAGSTICDLTGLYNVLTTLVPGQNNLVARVVDALGQYGPDSGTVTVFYDLPQPTPTPSPTSAPIPGPAHVSGPSAGAPGTPGMSPFIITSTHHYFEGAKPGAPVKWEMAISGGRPPYQLTWDWGDGEKTVSRSPAAGAISASHSYSSAGTYQVTVRATDAAGAEAVVQVVTVVNGEGAAGIEIRSKPDPGVLVFIWPLLVVAALLTGSFWLGERFKYDTKRPAVVA